MGKGSVSLESGVNSHYYFPTKKSCLVCTTSDGFRVTEIGVPRGRTVTTLVLSYSSRTASTRGSALASAGRGSYSAY